jgi:DNA invertase Pin-like site-specific DNA recombinase
MMNGLAIYTRVSTQDQSVDMQVSDLRHYCEQRGFQIYKEYSDHGISGTKDHRPGLDQLMSDGRKMRFDAVLCWRFDRFARSTKHLITALEEFRHLGIDFISYQENIDTSSPLGKAMFTIVSAIAELERNIITERIRGGIRRAKERGKVLGRPKVLNLDLDELSSLKEEGLSLRKIARRVNCSPDTVYKILSKSSQQSLDKSTSEGEEISVS